MSEILEKIWSENAVSFMNVIHTSQKNVLHPLLFNLINKQSPDTLLDYGCGDGRILKSISSSTKIDVLDINSEMLDLARFNAGDRINSYFDHKDQLPESMYDAVLLSMVLVCIDNAAEYLGVLKKIKLCKKVTGKVYIAVSHPCFRDRKFSNFQTSYGNEQPFKYLQDGEPFNVFIEDEMPPSVAFTDFHWPLSFTFNKICEAGLIIEKVIEPPDDKTNKNRNIFFSPFLIIIAN